MPHSAPSARWYCLWRTRTVDRDDPADYGTAFGLDMSLEPPSELDGAAQAAPAARRSWVPGWATRLHVAAGLADRPH